MRRCPNGWRRVLCASTMLNQKNAFLFGIVFGLHFVPFAFGSGKIGCASTMLNQKNAFLFGIVFGLHYLCMFNTIE